jgi:hypothetical protein
MTGNEAMLRMAVDMLIGKNPGGNVGNGDVNSITTQNNNSNNASCWWLSESSRVLKFDRVKLIRSVVIPEMSRNRSLQRVTNEIAIEVDALTPEQ